MSAMAPPAAAAAVAATRISQRILQYNAASVGVAAARKQIQQLDEEAVMILERKEQAKQRLDSEMRVRQERLGDWSYHGAWLAAHLQWQADTRAALRKQVTPESACHFWMSPLKLLTFRERTSASATVVGFAQLAADSQLLDQIVEEDREAFDRVSLKISFPPRCPTVEERQRMTMADHQRMTREHLENTLAFEREVIMHAFAQILDNLWCPHVVAPLADWHCMRDGGLDISLGQSRAHTLYQNAIHSLTTDSTLDIKIDPKRAGTHTLVMERGTCSLGQLFQKLLAPEAAPITDQEWYGLFFQCYYTLACLYRMGIRGNDSHCDNWLVRILSAPEDLYYLIPLAVEPTSPTLVHLRTRYIIKSFDYDRASAYFPHVHRNLGLDFRWCAAAGECSGMYSNDDTAGFTLNAIYRIFKYGYDKKENEWHNEYAEERMNTIIFALSSEKIFERFVLRKRPNELTQLWPHKARQLMAQLSAPSNNNNNNRQEKEEAAEYRDMLAAIKSPEDAMRAMIEHEMVTVEPPGTLLPADYALPRPFSLPPQKIIRLSQPKLITLGKHEHTLYATTPPLELMSTTLSARELTLNDFEAAVKGVGDLYWTRTFATWQAELEEDRLETPWRWQQAAAELWTHIAHSNPPKPFPSLRDQRALLVACLTLTCPMFVGMTSDARNQLRIMLAHSQQPLQVERIIAAESFIWSFFDEQLPVDVPGLYDEEEEEEEEYIERDYDFDEYDDDDDEEDEQQSEPQPHVNHVVETYTTPLLPRPAASQDFPPSPPPAPFKHRPTFAPTLLLPSRNMKK
jgi:hypothetical protein